MVTYLTLQDFIVEQLTAALPDVPVRTALSLDEVRDQSIGQPEIWVVFHRDMPGPTPDGDTFLTQQYAVIYLVPGVLPDPARDGARLLTILRALAGKEPRARELGRLRRVGSMVPQSWKTEGLVAYGQLFEADCHF